MSTSATPATALAGGSILDQKLAKSSPGKWGAVAFGIMLVGGLIYNRHEAFGGSFDRSQRQHLPFCFVGRGAADRAWLRVCQWVSRYGERGGYVHLHALAGTAYRGSLLGGDELHRCSDEFGRGGLFDHYAAAGGVDSEGE